jgi:hypothetical protein
MRMSGIQFPRRLDGFMAFCSGKFGQPGPMLPAMVNPQFDRITVNTSSRRLPLPLLLLK